MNKKGCFPPCTPQFLLLTRRKTPAMKHIALAALCCTLLSACSDSRQGSGFTVFWIIVAVLALFLLRHLFKPNPIKEHDAIHSHHSHHFEDFQMSATEFYQDLKDIIFNKGFPNVQASVSAFSTGGILDPYRDYLEIKSDTHVFYVCAAPYGKNCFISYWLKDTEEDIFDVVNRKVFGSGSARKSFFQIDSEAMFVESIKKAIMAAIDHTTEQKGLRKITPDERTPTIHA